MSLLWHERKTCNRVNIRHDLALLADQTRQSSITRETSDQTGTTSAGALPTLNAARPRLKATASRNGSNAAKSVVRWLVAGLKLAGAERDCEVVQIEMNGAAPLAGFAIETRRVERVQRIVSCGWLLAPTNVTSLPSAVCV